MVGCLRDWRRPNSTRNPLPESTMECTPSETIAAEPETAAAMNLTMPTAMLDAMAAMTEAVPPWAWPVCEVCGGRGA